MHKPVRTAAAAIYEHHDTYLLHICDGSESQRYKVSAGLLCPVYIFWLAAHETDETVFISLKNLRPTARSFYTINSTSEVRFTGVFKDTKARYMEIKKSKQAFSVAPGIELTTRNISHRKKAHQQYKSFILGYAEGVRVRFTVMILYFSLVKTFKIA